LDRDLGRSFTLLIGCALRSPPVQKNQRAASSG
jgi:hypothetical protein